MTIKRLTFRHKYEIVVGTGGLASVIVAVFYDFNHPDVPIFLNREQCEKKVADRKETLYNQTEIRVALDRWPEAQIRPPAWARFSLAAFSYSFQIFKIGVI